MFSGTRDVKEGKEKEGTRCFKSFFGEGGFSFLLGGLPCAPMFRGRVNGLANWSSGPDTYIDNAAMMSLIAICGVKTIGRGRGNASGRGLERFSANVSCSSVADDSTFCSLVSSQL